MRKLTMVAITLLTLISCTDNQRASSFGGTETVKLGTIEKKQNLLAPKNFIKFAENYALLY